MNYLQWHPVNMSLPALDGQPPWSVFSRHVLLHFVQTNGFHRIENATLTVIDPEDPPHWSHGRSGWSVTMDEAVAWAELPYPFPRGSFKHD